MSSLSLDEQLEIISRRWTDPDFSRKVIVTDLGCGAFSVNLETKDFKSLLAQKQKQESSLWFKFFGLRF